MVGKRKCADPVAGSRQRCDDPLLEGRISSGARQADTCQLKGDVGREVVSSALQSPSATYAMELLIPRFAKAQGTVGRRRIGRFVDERILYGFSSSGY